ncbi:MAG: group II intron maturase-specific domain-containing protein [Solirubrobacteraceae bacterium]
MPHPAAVLARSNRAASGLHLPIQASVAPGDGQGQGPHAPREASNTRRPAAPTQLGAAGWCNYFRHGAATQTFSYLDHFTCWRVVGWIGKRHKGLSWGELRRRHLPNWEISDGQVTLFRPRTVPVIRHRYRGDRIPTPWTTSTTA